MPALPDGRSRKPLLGHLIEPVSNNHQHLVRAALADQLDFPACDRRLLGRILVDLWACYDRYVVGSNPPVTLAADYVEHLVRCGSSLRD